VTISSTTRIAGPFTGNGVAYLFPFTFKVFTAEDLLVDQGVISDGTQTTLALGTDYVVALNANQDSNPGGSVALVAGPLAVGLRLTISSDLANLQPTELVNQGGFYPQVLTTSFDRATILIQQLQVLIDRAVRFPITDPSLNNVLPSAELRAGLQLAFDDNGAPIVVPRLPGPVGPPGPAGAASSASSLTLMDSATSGPYVGASWVLTVLDGAPTWTPGMGATEYAITIEDSATSGPNVGVFWTLTVLNGTPTWTPA
jgi:hypothetical protein